MQVCRNRRIHYLCEYIFPHSIEMKHIYTLIAAIFALALSSCSKSDHFSIGGTIDGVGMQSVTLTYYADGGLKRVTQAAVDGKFAMKGHSATPTLCLLELSDGTELATMVVSDGDKMKIKASLESPLATEVKGNGTSSKIARWIADNAEKIASGNAADINSAIAEFVGDNKSDLAATALMVTRFQTPGYETMADSLLTLISVDARPAAVVQNFSAVLASQLNQRSSVEVKPMSMYARNDSTFYFNPSRHSLSFLAFMSPAYAGRDSITPHLRNLEKRYPSRRLEIIEISTAADSALWKQSTAPDSATWTQAWAPGSIAANAIQKLAIPRNPYFIVADSVGVQLYRGSSISEAEKLITTRLK